MCMLFSVFAMGYVGICSFINVCWKLMGEDQKLAQQGDASNRQRLKGRRWMKLAGLAGRLLAAVWTRGGDLDHLSASWTVIFCSILAAKLERWADWKMGGSGWVIAHKGELLKVLFQVGFLWGGQRDQCCLAAGYRDDGGRVWSFPFVLEIQLLSSPPQPS